jgi:ankyrin repeat protein
VRQGQTVPSRLQEMRASSITEVNQHEGIAPEMKPASASHLPFPLPSPTQSLQTPNGGGPILAHALLPANVHALDMAVPLSASVSEPPRKKAGKPPLARAKSDPRQPPRSLAGPPLSQETADARAALAMPAGQIPGIMQPTATVADQPISQRQGSPNLNEEQEDNRSALMVALEGDLAGVASLLNRGYHVDQRDEDGNTLLHAASQNGCLLVVEHLLARDASIDVTNKRGVTPICIAMAYGHALVVDLLLECGADSSIVTEQGLSPLYFAVGRDRTNVVKVAIDAGLSASSLVKPVEKLSALHLSAARGNMDLIQMLLDHGADANATDDWGRCALHFAAYAGHSVVVLTLLKRGCNPTARTKRGTSASQIAKMKGYVALGALLANFESIFEEP